MAANTNIQFTTLDFNDIKKNFITYLQSQNVLKDYDYTGSALSTLLDVLAYNTQYNAFYLNMVGNETFLDTAIQRSSVVSQAKVLNYTPLSAIAPTATIAMNVLNVMASSLTIPQYTRFLSNAIDGVNYTFLTPEEYTVNVDTYNTASFPLIELKQATHSSFSYPVDTVGNPTLTFEIADPNIDTTTLQVTVQQSSSNTYAQIYNLSSNSLELNGSSLVYFLQQGPTGNYQIYFGDGVLGATLSTGNIVNITYLSTNGTAAAGANSFTLLDTISGYGTTTIFPLTPATNGADVESIQSIKFQAPKAYAAQNRAVTKNDYITAIQQNTFGYSFDAVNVWGGEEYDSPVFGQVFISLKPKGSFNFTTSQKNAILRDIIKPISVVTIQPTIVDPDYTYLKLNVDVYYDPTQTNKTSAQIQSGVVAAIEQFGVNTLNTFNSTFNAYDLLTTIQNYDPSILTSQYKLFLQKRIIPSLTSVSNYTVYFSTPLQKGIFNTATTSYPGMRYVDPLDPTNIVDNVFIEEVPTANYGLSSISLINPGFNYSVTPTVTISGDGTGATALATLSTTGQISNITLTNAGNNYTSAVVTITPTPNDGTGQGAAATAILQGQYGTLRLYYFDANGVKNILNPNIGTIDYVNGIVTLINFQPYSINNNFAELTIQATPTTDIISSTYNKIITIDPLDTNAVVVNVIAKTNNN